MLPKIIDGLQEVLKLKDLIPFKNRKIEVKAATAIG